MKLIFLGRKPYGAAALEYLIKRGVGIVCVVCPDRNENVYWHRKVSDTAHKNRLKVVSEDSLYEKIANNRLKDVDLVVSFLYWRKIKKPLLDLPKIGAINFHPAPLPDCKGWATYNYAINQNLNFWGGTAHFMDENFDSGDIIKVKKFRIDSESETALSLEFKTQRALYLLFKKIIDDLLAGKTLKTCPQKSPGVYLTKKELENLKSFSPEDPPEIIHRKIRAFWFPPFDGLNITVKDRKFTLIDSKILENLSPLVHKRKLKK